MAESYDVAFRLRYNLAPTDPRYLDATTEDILTDHWVHYYRQPGRREEIEDDNFDLDNIVKNMEDGDWEEIK